MVETINLLIKERQKLKKEEAEAKQRGDFDQEIFGSNRNSQMDCRKTTNKFFVSGGGIENYSPKFDRAHSVFESINSSSKKKYVS